MNRLNHSTIIILALMISFGALASASRAADTPPAGAGAKPKAVPAQKAEATEETLKQMSGQLKLTEAQQQKVKKVLEGSEQKMRAVLDNKKLAPQEIGAKGREIRSENDRQIREILTPDQYQQWQKMLAQRGIRRR